MAEVCFHFDFGIFQASGTGYCCQGTAKASRIARSKELLGVGFSTLASDFFWHGDIKVKHPVFGAHVSFSASGVYRYRGVVYN